MGEMWKSLLQKVYGFEADQPGRLLLGPPDSTTVLGFDAAC